MKYSIVVLLILACFNVNAQITLEHTYSEAGFAGSEGSWQQLYVAHLEVDGDKFVFADKANKEIKLYHPDHTLWKTIDFSAATDLNAQNNSQNISYISQHLFDLDDEIEFLYVDNSSTSVIEFVTQVVNEDGTILFTANQQSTRMIPSAPQTQLPIYNTTAGTKMILSGAASANDGNAYVYSLQGSLSVGIEEDQAQFIEQGSARAYPNPTSDVIQMDYRLPFGVYSGYIILMDTQGNEVQRVSVSGGSGNTELPTNGLAAGVYHYNLSTDAGVIPCGKLVVQQ